MTTTETGRKAETAARVYLEMRGYKILEQNFRRPRCEIDIIAMKNGTIHFVEVKYRRDYGEGGGLDAITATKLKQMRMAAFMWCDESKWHGLSVLSAVEVAGREFTVMSFLDDVY